MSELKTYDEAAGKFYTRKKYQYLPLLSWDIYSEAYTKFAELSSDLNHLNGLSKSWKIKWDFKKELYERERIIILTDPSREIVYTSYNVSELNGYKREELIGRSPKIFQGEGTDKGTIAYIKEAIQEEKPFDVKLLNYKKDGTPYTCHIEAYPVHNKKGKLINFIAFERAA
ncbi:PAS domain-containing protein [Leptobacterium flavescens]|uniref:PAS domain-containing protein n=1 Tax=Leptobacterium flavescens TaxID=472055 RepID=A0A6P0URB8_9FLAO|nr:PAS domain-containing protein [Leptobacterium flavescens]NER14319.1 PAS domain-containing protein [Leptobacterium flavescens]